jgi:hypothetical protein
MELILLHNVHKGTPEKGVLFLRSQSPRQAADRAIRFVFLMQKITMRGVFCFAAACITELTTVDPLFQHWDNRIGTARNGERT